MNPSFFKRKTKKTFEPLEQNVPVEIHPGDEFCLVGEEYKILFDSISGSSNDSAPVKRKLEKKAEPKEDTKVQFIFF
jgi:hypothetical protein